MTFGWLFGYSQEEEYVTNEDLEDLFDEDKHHSGTQLRLFKNYFENFANG